MEDSTTIRLMDGGITNDDAPAATMTTTTTMMRGSLIFTMLPRRPRWDFGVLWILECDLSHENGEIYIVVIHSYYSSSMTSREAGMAGGPGRAGPGRGWYDGSVGFVLCVLGCCCGPSASAALYSLRHCQRWWESMIPVPINVKFGFLVLVPIRSSSSLH